MSNAPASGGGRADIQFVDLASQHRELWPAIERFIAGIFEESAFVGGAHVAGFEKDFADFLGAPHAIGVSNGTDAVRIALELAGARHGDAMVTVSHTFIGTIEGAVQLGVLPIFVDIDEESYTMSPDALRTFFEEECTRSPRGAVHRRTGRRIAAVVPVHLYGQSAHMEPIMAMCAEQGVPVVEDAAQAQGARYRFEDGRTAACGAMGDAAAFSFYPSKNLGAAGEAGAVIVADAEAAARARRLREHGQSEKYVHETAHAGNYRLDGMQAGLLRLKLQRLNDWNDSRRRAAADYGRLLASADLVLPREMPWAHHVYHLYVVQVEDRDAVRSALEVHGIPTGLHYPLPLHLQPGLRSLDVIGGPLAVTERVAARCLSLPMHGHLDPAAVEIVADRLAETVGIRVGA